MDGLDEINTLYDQLEELLEEDYVRLSDYLKGDLYEEYKKLILEEKQLLENSRAAMLQSINI